MNAAVRPKKHLGQHFLRDEHTATEIVKSLTIWNNYKNVLEVGPGMGVLTKYLIKIPDFTTYVIDIDSESITYLKTTFPTLNDQIIEGDFLHLDFSKHFANEPFAVIGNFPYNISTQIMFRLFEERNQIPELVGMFQKEVAARIASKPSNKNYGILSVFIQAFYDVEFLFTVDAALFNPPPKVQSAVIRCKRNKVHALDCDELLFFKVVKAAFNQRRKMLRNALSQFIKPDKENNIPYLNLRAENLSWQQFVELTNAL